MKNAVLNLELKQIEEIMDLPKTVCAEKEGKNLTTIGKIWTGCENQGKYALLIRTNRGISKINVGDSVYYFF